MDTDRKVVTVLLAKVLNESLDTFVKQSAGHAHQYLGMGPEEWRSYLLERLPDALDLIKAHKSE